MFVFRFLQGFFTSVKKLRVCFNPEMSFEARQATVWDVHNPDPIGIRVSHPAVLVSHRPKHLMEIRRQAQLCGYDVTHLTTSKNTYPMENQPISSKPMTNQIVNAIGNARSVS